MRTAPDMLELIDVKGRRQLERLYFFSAGGETHALTQREAIELLQLDGHVTALWADHIRGLPDRPSPATSVVKMLRAAIDSFVVKLSDHRLDAPVPFRFVAPVVVGQLEKGTVTYRRVGLSLSGVVPPGAELIAPELN